MPIPTEDPFGIGDEPRHRSPDFAGDLAFQRVTAREQGAKLASRRLGL